MRRKKKRNVLREVLIVMRILYFCMAVFGIQSLVVKVVASMPCVQRWVVAMTWKGFVGQWGF